jgi:hypothetical protein
MENIISPETFVALLQLGGQYLLPAAALLRALYAGIRGNLPEGFVQIALASVFAGILSVLDRGELNLRDIILTIASNTLFTAGLLAFIVAYLLRMPYRGQAVDGAVGAFVGLATWFISDIILLDEWAWWTVPLFIIGGGLAFITLRTLLRQIARLVKFATYLIVAGLVLVAGAGGLFILSSLFQPGA